MLDKLCTVTKCKEHEGIEVKSTVAVNEGINIVDDEPVEYVEQISDLGVLITADFADAQLPKMQLQLSRQSGKINKYPQRQRWDY